jgi:hypothetical protein
MVKALQGLDGRGASVVAANLGWWPTITAVVMSLFDREL